MAVNYNLGVSKRVYNVIHWLNWLMTAKIELKILVKNKNWRENFKFFCNGFLLFSFFTIKNINYQRLKFQNPQINHQTLQQNWHNHSTYKNHFHISTILYPHPFQLIQQLAFFVWLFSSTTPQNLSRLRSFLSWHKLTFIKTFSYFHYCLQFNSLQFRRFIVLKKEFLDFYQTKNKILLVIFEEELFAVSWMRDFDARGGSLKE